MKDDDLNGETFADISEIDIAKPREKEYYYSEDNLLLYTGDGRIKLFYFEDEKTYHLFNGKYRCCFCDRSDAFEEALKILVMRYNHQSDIINQMEQLIEEAEIE